MEDGILEEIAIKINWHTSSHYDNGIWKNRDTNLPLNGKYIDEDKTIYYFKQGKWHNENGPAYFDVNRNKEYYINGKIHRINGPAAIYSNGDYDWYINDYHINKERMNNWLTENEIPLDWNIWTDSDKMLFALHWSDYNG